MVIRNQFCLKTYFNTDLRFYTGKEVLKFENSKKTVDSLTFKKDNYKSKEKTGFRILYYATSENSLSFIGYRSFETESVNALNLKLKNEKLYHYPFVRIVNLSKLIRELKDKGYPTEEISAIVFQNYLNKFSSVLKPDDYKKVQLRIQLLIDSE